MPPAGQSRLPAGNVQPTPANCQLWRSVQLRLAAKTAALTAAVLFATGLNRASAQDPDLIFSVLSSACPASGSWPINDPVGGSLSRNGSPTTTTINGQNWEWNNRMTSQDGWRVGGPYTSIPCNGVTIVAAVRPVYCNPGGENRGEIVDIMYDRLALAISHADGRIMVCRNYWVDYGPAIPNGQITVLSLVVQPNGSYQVFANGTSVMTGGANGDFSTAMVPTDGAGFKQYIDVGRNDPDGWSAFNGNIGDVYLYKVAIDATKRSDLETAMMTKFGTASMFTITATAGTGGSISPAGAVPVPQNTSQSFAITTNYGYILNDVVVDTVSQGAVSSYTFTNVTADHAIAASWTALPTFSGTVTGPSGPIYSAKVALSNGTSVMTNAAGQYTIIATPDGSYTLTASKGGFTTSAALPATMTGGVSVTGLDISLTSSGSLDPIVVLDASTLTEGTDLAAWPNTGSLGGSFNKYAGGTGPNVVANYAGTGKQAVEFIQLTQDDAGRRTLASSIPAPSTITGSSDWSISTDLYRADMGGNDSAYMSWSGSQDGNGGTANFFYKNNYAYGHWGIDRGFNTVPSAGAWHNVTITFDGTNEKIYVDGTLDRSDVSVLKIGLSHMMIVGSRTDNNTQGNDNYWRFNGAIAKLQIFDQALSASDVATIAGAPTYNWAGADNGVWSDLANWNNTIPVAGKVAFLSNAGAGATVQLDAPVVVSGVEFNNLVTNQTIAATAPANTITLKTIVIDAGTHSISANVLAPSGLQVSGGGQLTLSGATTSGGGGFVVSQINGATVALSGSGSWTDTSGSYAAVGNTATSSTLTVNDSATLDWSGAASLCIAWGENGSGKVVQNGGTVKTPTTATAWYNNNGPGIMMGRWDGLVSTAEYDLNGGTLIACNVYGINEGSGNTVLPPVAPVLFKFNGGVLQATQNDSTDGSVIIEGTNHLLGNMTHAYVGNNGAKVDTVAFTCSIDQDLEHDPSALATDGGLTKMGAGTLTLLRAASYTGTTKVQAGTLACATTASLAPTAVELDASATLQLSYAGTQTVSGLKIGGVTMASGVYGGLGSILPTIADSHISGTGTLTVAGSPYSTWAATYPGHDLSNPAADLDHDGQSNFQEFAFGLDPTKGSSVNPISVPYNKTTHKFSYTRLAASGLAYTVWTSTNLQAWSGPAAVTESVGAPNGAGVVTVEVTLTSPPAGNALFVRVKAE